MPLRDLLGWVWGSNAARRPASAPDAEEVPFAREDERHPAEPGLTARRFLVVVGLSLVLLLIWQLRELVILVFLAILIAAAMHGPSALLERFMPRLAAVAVAYLAVVALLAALVLFVVPPLVDQAGELVSELPTLVAELQRRLAEVADAIAGPGAGERAIDAVVPRIEDTANAEPLLELPFTMLAILVNTLVVVFLSALLLLERDAIRRWALRFFVARDRRPVVDLVHDALTKLGAYVRGQLLVMAITGVGTAAGMLLLGVPFAVPMGLLGFLAEAIPLAGPILLAIPVLLLAWLESPTTAGLMLVWLVALQQIEGWVIYPLVQGRMLSLSPAVVVLAVLAGAQLYGVLGAVIAVPVVAVGDVVIRDVVFPLRRRASRADLESAVS